MALTVSVAERNVVGNQRMNTVDVTFDASYPTGGEAITANQCGLTRIDAIIPFGVGTNVIVYDAANAKLMAYDMAGAEVVDATNLSAVSVRLIAFGA